ncbi:MAG: DUF2807 domain-containing protein [Dehalococcoidales bacterium]|nr:DUF2807 domain-containing protein [Dehalococcoidales bacterium]
MSTREYRFSDFSEVTVGGAFEVDVQQSDSYSIVVEADWLTFQSIKVSRQGEMLSIGRRWHPLAWIPGSSRPKATITMPVLKGLAISGATRVTVSGFKSSEDFRMELSGASRITGDLGVGNARLVLSGASRADLSGSSGNLTADISGASRIEMGGFEVQDASLVMSGASRMTANVNSRLNAELSGASRLHYKGEPAMGDIRTSGASRLDKTE